MQHEGENFESLFFFPLHILALKLQERACTFQGYFYFSQSLQGLQAQKPCSRRVPSASQGSSQLRANRSSCALLHTHPRQLKVGNGACSGLPEHQQHCKARSSVHSSGLANAACKRPPCSASPTKGLPQQQQPKKSLAPPLPAASGLLTAYKGAFLPTLRFPGGRGISCLCSHSHVVGTFATRLHTAW